MNSAARVPQERSPSLGDETSALSLACLKVWGLKQDLLAIEGCEAPSVLSDCQDVLMPTRNYARCLRVHYGHAWSGKETGL